MATAKRQWWDCWDLVSCSADSDKLASGFVDGSSAVFEKIAAVTAVSVVGTGAGSVDRTVDLTFAGSAVDAVAEPVAEAAGGTVVLVVAAVAGNDLTPISD